MTEKNWKNRGKYGGNWTQVEELEIALKILREDRERFEAERLSRTSTGDERKSSS